MRILSHLRELSESLEDCERIAGGDVSPGIKRTVIML